MQIVQSGTGEARLPGLRWAKTTGEFDIANFFGEIDHERLLAEVEARPEPDSGNPAVRDRGVALRNVVGNASGVLVRALNFEPDNRTHGWKGGWGNTPAMRVLRP